MTTTTEIKTSAERRIRELAQTHGVTAKMANIDHVAKKFTELSDSDMEYNEIRQLAVNLSRAGVLTRTQALNLYGEHLKAS